MTRSNLRPRTSLLLWVVGLANLALLAGGGAFDVARAALTEAQKCRSAIETQNSRYLARTHRIRQRCLHGVFRGRLPLTTDCVNGEGDDKAAAHLSQVRARVAQQLVRGCTGIDLEQLGYPGQCPDETGAPFDSSDLEQCIGGENDDIVARMLELEYPPVTFLPSRYLHCVNGVGLRGGDVVRSELRARSSCLFRDEVDLVVDSECREQMTPYGPGTADPKTNDRVLRSYVGLLAGIPDVCSGLNVDFLGYTDDCEDTTGGRFNTFDLKLCLFDTHRRLAQESLRLAFPTAAVCGDGEVDPDEQCDDGNTSDTDACLGDCTLARCGDTFVRTGVEECDDGNTVETDACLNSCKLAKCGDGITHTGFELCDDGNQINTDCVLERLHQRDLRRRLQVHRSQLQERSGRGPRGLRRRQLYERRWLHRDLRCRVLWRRHDQQPYRRVRRRSRQRQRPEQVSPRLLQAPGLRRPHHRRRATVRRDLRSARWGDVRRRLRGAALWQRRSRSGRGV